jgi:cbb3-type cytochrome oxidase subunit 3
MFCGTFTLFTVFLYWGQGKKSNAQAKNHYGQKNMELRNDYLLTFRLLR